MKRKQWWSFAVLFFIGYIVLTTTGNLAFELSLLTSDDALFLTRTIQRTTAFVFLILALSFGFAGYYEKEEGKKK